MSQHALRHGRLAYIICSSCIRSGSHRFYSAQVALLSSDVAELSQSGLSNSAAEALRQPPPTVNPQINKEKGRRRRNNAVPTADNLDVKESSTKQSNAFVKTEMYLSKLHAEGVKPTIADLERLRPRRHSPPTSRKFVEEHNALVDTLCRAFSKEQLREFLELYGTDPALYRPKRRKMYYAEAIVEKQWGWPSLKELEKMKRDKTEITHRVFNVSRSELFLFLGQDGSQMLHLSRKYNIHIQLLPKPLSLRVEGVKENLDKLAEQLSNMRKEFVSEIFTLPTKNPVPEELVQRISRLAEAFLENQGDGRVRITAKDSNGLEIAKRLVSRAVQEVNSSLMIPHVSYQPPAMSIGSSFSPISFPQAYSLYPFLSPRSLPWTMNTTGAFRIRRVGEWLVNSQGEDVERTGGLAGGQGRIFTSDMKPLQLQSVLQDIFPHDNNDPLSKRRYVKASLGHMLVTTPSTKGQQSNLVPPLKGYHSYSKVLNWMETSDVRTSFVPSLPSPLVNVSPSAQTLLHRLVYQSYTPSDSSEGLREQVKSDDQFKLPSFRTITFEFELAGSDAIPEGSEGVVSEAEREKRMMQRVPSIVVLKPRGFSATEHVLNVMMPDRPMDMRLSFCERSEIDPTEIPKELQQYLAALRHFVEDRDVNTQPLAPLLLKHDGSDYILSSVASVRQSTERLPSNEIFDSPTIATAESVLDIESNQKTTQCEVICTDPLSQDNWQKFLRDCDRLTTVSYRPASTIDLSSIDDEFGRF
ncbi:hypothetical protein K474DRAFT_1657966 [Panus rudis PR-1116 ss-1]|nr:hypothetical protein K474DRAFT_1657966 [Panus rudis PR-1116 ss-1]